MLNILNKTKANGETYVQYPGEESPAVLFGGTWTAMFENEGIFFRTPGGTAGAFNSGIQAAANQAHNHNRGNMEISGTFGKQKCTLNGNINIGGAFNTSSYPNGNTIGTDFFHGGSIIDFYASRTWSGVTSTDGVSEARPKNRTFRVWKRIS